MYVHLKQHNNTNFLSEKKKNFHESNYNRHHIDISWDTLLNGAQKLLTSYNRERGPYWENIARGRTPSGTERAKRGQYKKD